MKIHKNLHVVALAAAMMALGAQADPVTDRQAVCDAVSAWTAANGTAFDSPGSAVAAEPMYDDDGTNILYWIVAMSNGGAVVASPDTDLDLVVAVLENYDGSFPAGHPMPAILKKDMRNRLAVLAKRKADSVRRPRLLAAATTGVATEEKNEKLEAAITAANDQWAKYGVAKKSGRPRLRADSLGANVAAADASPYVRCIVDGFETGGRYTHWDQGAVNGNYCYNYYTPGTPGYPNAVCGCVATAGSAILQFFNCTNDPGNVTGSPTYGENLEPAPAAYCVTKAGKTDWSVLPKSYGGAKEGTGVLDDAGRELLGRVAFNVGVLVDMMWDVKGPGTESGAFLVNLVSAFKKYGFKTARHVLFESGKEADNEHQFTKTVYAQVWSGAPVILGISGDKGAHAVVACGYARDPDGDQFCRVFMGWSGSHDGWYKFPEVDDFKLVEDAVTMIGYQDDAVVPVYGSANIPGVELELPGYVTNGVTVTTFVNANGFFGVRVPPSLTDLRIGYAPRNRYAPIQPFDVNTLEDEAAERADLDAAIPDEIELSILNADVRYTMESACAVAARDGKALLMVGGLSGGDRSSALMEYLYGLDDTTDFSNKFVLVFNNIKSTDANRPDGDPVIGVFDPAVFNADERWKESNGRLSYEAFIDYEATEASANGAVYTFSSTNTVALTNGVDVVLETGYDRYLRLHSGIAVTITGVNADSGSNVPFEMTEVIPAYGAYDELNGIWTNGEVAVFSAPGSYTNEAKGIVYSCVGWSTNEVFVLNGKKWELQPYNKGSTANIQLFSGDDFTLTWVWKASHFRVTGTMDAQGAVVDQGTAVTPSEVWVVAGGRATLSAQPKIRDGAGTVLCSFSEWTVEGSVDYDALGNEISEAAVLRRNGTAVSFTVNEPVSVVAEYRDGDGNVAEARTSTLTLVSSPAELAAAAPPPILGSFAWGENTMADSCFVFQEATCTDATGGVWICTNIVVNGISFGPSTFGTGFLDLTVTCQWVIQENSGSGSEEPTPPAPVPGAITITAIEQAADGSWTITVSGAVKDCWYWLYAANNLAALSGETWTAGKATTTESNPQQATADGTIVFHATAAGAPCFWRAKATSTETGN